MITKEDCINDSIKYFLDSSGHRWKKNGKCKTWCRNSNRFEQPIKHGLYAYAYITDTNCNQFSIDTKQ